ncbi:unnamed protein product [Triticum turgidum subsp. durum]|uniref:Uncharacterized protein n=1 Tax=Triticum turgidum subsp. durum TaxID=4567 RepID=A0A9R1R784_TRITD|nr:unnamed protein product [Triticum turgidum subsp. durum]
MGPGALVACGRRRRGDDGSDAYGALARRCRCGGGGHGRPTAGLSSLQLPWRSPTRTERTGDTRVRKRRGAKGGRGQEEKGGEAGLGVLVAGGDMVMDEEEDAASDARGCRDA